MASGSPRRSACSNRLRLGAGEALDALLQQPWEPRASGLVGGRDLPVEGGRRPGGVHKGQRLLRHRLEARVDESGQPEISRTKRAGLLDRYGFEDTAGTAYFRIHSTRDVEHAAEVRELASELGADDEDRLVAAAESAFRANWRLLDGV